MKNSEKGLLQFNSKILETVILFLSTKRKYMEMRKNFKEKMKQNFSMNMNMLKKSQNT